MIWVDGARISHVINPESWKTARLGAAGIPRGPPVTPVPHGRRPGGKATGQYAAGPICTFRSGIMAWKPRRERSGMPD